jgi:hypothetical protein
MDASSRECAVKRRAGQDAAIIAEDTKFFILRSHLYFLKMLPVLM